MNFVEDRALLGLTKPAIQLYFMLPHEETRKLVETCAIHDWGDGTACMFFEDRVEVEHLDGRKEIVLCERILN